MSARRSFIKNSLMAIAVSLLPKVLRPMEPEIVEENIEMEQVQFEVRTYLYNAEAYKDYQEGEPMEFAMMLPKELAQKLHEVL